MLHYLVTRRHRYTMDDHLATPWAASMPDVVNVLPYEDAFTMRVLPAGAYVFTDLDRLSAGKTRLAISLWERIAESGQPVRRLNDPTRVSSRHDLLCSLHASGANDFRVFRADEPLPALRFPVFLRQAREHTGNLTRLLVNARELEHGRKRVADAGLDLSDVLVVEFCDTASGGRYTKYSAFRVGDAIVPRSVNVADGWMVKAEHRIMDQEIADCEEAYVRDNPHETWIRSVFELASIEYGRIDYSMLGDRPQVWEINTNPGVGRQRKSGLPDADKLRVRALRRRTNDCFYARFEAALRAVAALP